MSRVTGIVIGHNWYIINLWPQNYDHKNWTEAKIHKHTRTRVTRQGKNTDHDSRSRNLESYKSELKLLHVRPNILNDIDYYCKWTWFLHLDGRKKDRKKKNNSSFFRSFWKGIYFPFLYKPGIFSPKNSVLPISGLFHISLLRVTSFATSVMASLIDAGNGTRCPSWHSLFCNALVGDTKLITLIYMFTIQSLVEHRLNINRIWKKIRHKVRWQDWNAYTCTQF